MNHKTSKKLTIQNSYSRNDEIDLYNLFEVLFKHKLIIITFTLFFTFLGLMAYFLTPKSYELTSKISPSKDSVFSDYFRLNKHIQVFNNLYTSEKMSQNSFNTKNEYYKINEPYEINEPYKITSLNIFKFVIDEFNDYEEGKGNFI